MHSAPRPSTELLDSALRRVVLETGAAVGAVYRLSLDGEDRTLRLVRLSGLPRKAATPWARLPLRDPIPLGEAVLERRLVWVPNQAELARRYPGAALVMPYDFALAVAPVGIDDQPQGALSLLWPGTQPSPLDAHTADTLRAACVEMAPLLAAAHPPGEDARVPRRTTDVALSPGAAAQQQLVDRLPEGHCSVDTEGRITFLSNDVAELAGRRAEDLLGTSLWEAFPWLDDPVFIDRYRASVFSHQATSVTVQRPPYHQVALGLHADATGMTLRILMSDDDASTAQQRSGVREQADPWERAGSLYDLMHLAASLTQAVSVQDVVALGAERIMSAFGAEGFVVSVAEGNALHIVGHRGYDPEVIRHLDHPPFQDDRAPTVRAVTTGEPLFFATPEEMARFHPDIPRLTKRSAWAFLPLIVSDRVAGCCVVSFDRPHPFGHDERALLTSLAALLAQALDRARLYDAKNQLAQELQTTLLPTSLPQVPGLDMAVRYLPASRGMEVGGDFYEVMRLDETTVAATIGDVQGHSVNAAALMGQVRTAVHATTGAPPSEVLARTNRLLTDLDTDLFTSCLDTSVDLAQHRVRLANAGHPPPLLRHPDGHTEVLNLPPGLLLGVDSAADYEIAEVPLPPGAVLVLYTDGLVEAPGIDLGDAVADLAAKLSRSSPEQGMDDLADALIHPNQHADQRHDDIALLLLRPSPDG